MKLTTIITLTLVCCLAALGQPTTTTPAVALPTAVSIVGEFNQLATPQWALGISALYTTGSQASIAMYNTSTADVIPVQATDPTTGKKFIAISASFRQGLHEKVLATGPFAFLLGADIGPGFSSTPAGGIQISATGSFVATAIYHANSWLSVVVPVRMLYVQNVGWNPVLQAGISFNLSKLPPPK
jgi:hypothetical protein